MDNNQIKELLAEIQRANPLLTSAPFHKWNPIEEFIRYVSPKEICHSRILAQLFDPNGEHGLGTVFLGFFLYEANIFRGHSDDEMTDVKVSTERPVRNGRRIDIFIEWTDPTGKKWAVIVENKLNGACYQTNQLQDYREAIEAEGYDVVKVVCLHLLWSISDSEIKYADHIMYAKDLAIAVLDNAFRELEMEERLAEIHYTAIYPYISYLINLSYENQNMATAKQLLDLDEGQLYQIAALVAAFKKINDAKNDLMLDYLRKHFPDISSEKSSLERDEQISFWRKNDYDRNRCWVCVHYPKNPENDSDGTDLWLVCKSDNKANGDAIADKLGFVYSGEGKYRNDLVHWYRHPQEHHYTFFNKQSRENLLEAIVGILNELSE